MLYKLELKIVPRLSLHPCVHHDVMDIFGCKCTLASCQYSSSLINLGQNKVRLPKNKLETTKNNELDCHKPYGEWNKKFGCQLSVAIVNDQKISIIQSGDRRRPKFFNYLGWWPQIGDWNFLGNDKNNSIMGSMATIDQMTNFFLGSSQKHWAAQKNCSWKFLIATVMTKKFWSPKLVIKNWWLIFLGIAWKIYGH